MKEWLQSVFEEDFVLEVSNALKRYGDVLNELLERWCESGKEEF